MSLRLAEGKRLQWIDTRRESEFSNFLFVDQEYAAHPVMRRIGPPAGGRAPDFVWPVATGFFLDGRTERPRVDKELSIPFPATTTAWRSTCARAMAVP